jgi:hypothetical protein
MTKATLCCLSVFALITAVDPAYSGQNNDDCEGKISKLDASPAEGEERLREKNLVIDYCARQYKDDKTINRLVSECAKYVEQPVIKQQFAAECMLAAYNYANALYTLRAEYGK